MAKIGDHFEAFGISGEIIHLHDEGALCSMIESADPWYVIKTHSDIPQAARVITVVLRHPMADPAKIYYLDRIEGNNWELMGLLGCTLEDSHGNREQGAVLHMYNVVGYHDELPLDVPIKGA